MISGPLLSAAASWCPRIEVLSIIWIAVMRGGDGTELFQMVG